MLDQAVSSFFVLVRLFCWWGWGYENCYLPITRNKQGNHNFLLNKLCSCSYCNLRIRRDLRRHFLTSTEWYTARRTQTLLSRNSNILLERSEEEDFFKTVNCWLQKQSSAGTRNKNRHNHLPLGG